MSAVYQSALDGCQRMDVRNYLLMGANVANLLLCFALVPDFGLLGAAYARLVQAVLFLAALWYALRREMPSLNLLPRRWDGGLFREMFS